MKQVVRMVHEGNIDEYIQGLVDYPLFLSPFQASTLYLNLGRYGLTLPNLTQHLVLTRVMK